VVQGTNSDASSNAGLLPGRSTHLRDTSDLKELLKLRIEPHCLSISDWRGCPLCWCILSLVRDKRLGFVLSQKLSINRAFRVKGPLGPTEAKALLELGSVVV